MGRIEVGTCGFSTNQKTYFRTFSLIEIQKTFYQPPQVKTAERWRHEAPEDFEFTLKAFQAITHEGSSPTYRRSSLSEAERAECGSFRDTQTVRRAWETTLEIARALQASFVVFQCPARFTPTEQHLKDARKFFEWAPREGLRFGFEPRGGEWTQRAVRDLCRDLDLVHVVDPFQDRPVYGTPRYFRLHGNGDVSAPQGYSHHYDEAELRRLAEQCTARLTYCLFNNVAMREDAERFRETVQQAR